MSFSGLNLVEPLLRAVTREGYTRPTPIQEKAIPEVLAGRDLLGCAQTGTGKTAAFALPLLQRLAARRAPGIRALVLSPTRELAAQIAERMTAYGRDLGITNAAVFGGVGQFHQERALRASPSVLVATPGRLLDLCSQHIVDLSKIEILVLDEADRMLDMGFIHDVRRIVGMTPKARQTLLFSATLPQEIAKLAQSILKTPVRVDVAPKQKTADTVGQAVQFVSTRDKRVALVNFLRDPSIDRVLVFTRTRHGASRVARHLEQAGIRAGAIHGDKTQGARERALSEFRAGRTRVLVATDIAARGIDVEGISHVLNYDVPMDPESYVHRIGRTGRAGASGSALTFCDSEERSRLKSIERLIGRPIPEKGADGFDVDPSAAHPLASSEPILEEEERGNARRARSPRESHGPGRGGHRPGGNRREPPRAEAERHPPRRNAAPSRSGGDRAEAPRGPHRASGERSDAPRGPHRAGGERTDASRGPHRAGGDRTDAPRGPHRAGGERSDASRGPHRAGGARRPAADHGERPRGGPQRSFGDRADAPRGGGRPFGDRAEGHRAGPHRTGGERGAHRPPVDRNDSHRRGPERPSTEHAAPHPKAAGNFRPFPNDRRPRRFARGPG